MFGGSPVPPGIKPSYPIHHGFYSGSQRHLLVPAACAPEKMLLLSGSPLWQCPLALKLCQGKQFPLISQSEQHCGPSSRVSFPLAGCPEAQHVLGIAAQSLGVPRTPGCPSPVTSLPPPLALGNIGTALNILTLDGSWPALPFLASVFRLADRSLEWSTGPVVDLWWHVGTKLSWVALSWLPALGCSTELNIIRQARACALSGL